MKQQAIKSVTNMARLSNRATNKLSPSTDHSNFYNWSCDLLNPLLEGAASPCGTTHDEANHGGAIHGGATHGDFEEYPWCPHG